MNKHRMLLDLAKEAIQNLHDDTSVPKQQTKEDLEELVDEIQFKIKALAV
jgi:hypothetical protein